MPGWAATRAPWTASGGRGSGPRGRRMPRPRPAHRGSVIRNQVRSGPSRRLRCRRLESAPSGPPVGPAVSSSGRRRTTRRTSVSSPARRPASGSVGIDRQHRDPPAADPPLDPEQVRARLAQRDRRRPPASAAGPRGRPGGSPAAGSGPARGTRRAARLEKPPRPSRLRLRSSSADAAAAPAAGYDCDSGRRSSSLSRPSLAGRVGRQDTGPGSCRGRRERRSGPADQDQTARPSAASRASPAAARPRGYRAAGRPRGRG